MDATAYSSFGAPHGMAVDKNGNLFVAFTYDAIVEYTTNGSSLFVTNIGAPNLLGFDNLGRLYGNSNDCVVSITTNGASSYASGIAGLNGFCFDHSGNLYASTSSQILRISPDGTRKVFTTPADAMPVSPQPAPGGFIPSFMSVAIDGKSNIYAAIDEYEGNNYYYATKLDTNGVGVANTQIGGQNGTGLNIVADENTNVISTALYGHAIVLNGPFGSITFNNVVFGVPNTQVAFTPLDEALAFYAPTIVLQPKSQTLAAGSSASLKSSASGSSPISYQWFFNQTNLVAGATNSTLTLTNLTSAQSGQYAMMASNYLGSTMSQSASLSVLPALTINIVPAISVYGGIGSSYSIQYVNVIGPTNAWVTLATITLTNSPQYYFDVSAIGQPARFYRSVLKP